MAVAVAEQNLLIGGEWVDARSGKEVEQTNPYTEETVGRAAAAGGDDVDAAVKAAQGAFEAWGFGPPAARREVLTKAADLLQERAEEISGIVTEETGGTFGWGMFNCQLASGMLREAGAQAYAAVGQVIPSDIPGATAIARRLPAGVVVGIAPWNAPVILGTRAIATPLAYGNTVILKGSELCPRTHAQIVRCVQDAGAPEGVVNYLTNDPGDAAEVVEALIAHPGTRRINFTGSTKVGKIIAEKCGANLKRCLLELGGKAPMIVMADADLDEAVNAANFGAFMHSGQICMATERIIVDSKVAGRVHRRARQEGERDDGRRPDQPRDDDRPADQQGVGRARHRAGRGREVQGRRGGDRRRGGGPLLPPDGADQGDARDARVLGGVVRPDRPDPRIRRHRRRDQDRERHQLRALGRGVQLTTSRPRSTSPGGSRAGSATSTWRPSTTRRRCRSAASRRAAGAGSEAARRSRSSPTSTGPWS